MTGIQNPNPHPHRPGSPGHVHPTAVVDPRATLADDVSVGPYAVVDGPVSVGPGCVLHAHATVLGHTVLGRGNHVFPGAVIGAEPPRTSSTRARRPASRSVTTTGSAST